jgi:hypothetical protein
MGAGFCGPLFESGSGVCEKTQQDAVLALKDGAEGVSMSI